jgi:Ni/Fe-hydrogenase subunit HybB-like protein
MLNKIFNIVNRFIYYSNHPTPQEVVTAIITGLAIGIMFGFWLQENNLNSWDKFKNQLKKNKKLSWIFKK